MRRRRRPRPAHPLLALQAAAGNQAVARALLQRDSFGLVTRTARRPVVPGLNTQLDPSIMAGLDKRQKEVQARVRAWMVQHQAVIQGQVVAGMSLPEVIDFVRTSVKEATELAPETIGKLAQEVVARCRSLRIGSTIARRSWRPSCAMRWPRFRPS